MFSKKSELNSESSIQVSFLKSSISVFLPYLLIIYNLNASLSAHWTTWKDKDRIYLTFFSEFFRREVAP